MIIPFCVLHSNTCGGHVCQPPLFAHLEPHPVPSFVTKPKVYLCFTNSHANKHGTNRSAGGRIVRTRIGNDSGLGGRRGGMGIELSVVSSARVVV